MHGSLNLTLAFQVWKAQDKRHVFERCVAGHSLIQSVDMKINQSASNQCADLLLLMGLGS